MSRPTTYTIAAILQFLVSLLSVVLGIPALMPGSTMTAGIPYWVVLESFATGTAGLVSAYGVWRVQRWGVILTIGLRLVDGLVAIPGILFAPTPEAKLMASIGVALSALIIVLLLVPSPRPATA